MGVSIKFAVVPRFRAILMACLGAVLIGPAAVSDPARADERASRPDVPPPIPRLPRDDLLVYRGPGQEPTRVRNGDDWLKRRGEILAGMQAVMGRLPGPEKRCPLDVKVEEEVDCGSHV